MVNANPIRQILSGPGALAQDLDGTFFLLTNCPPENSQLAQMGAKVIPVPNLFTPAFFEITPSDNQKFEFCLKIGRRDLLILLERTLTGVEQSETGPWVLQEKSDYEVDFGLIQDGIQSGLFDKAVVMSTESATWVPTPEDRLSLLLNLLKNCPSNLYIYGHWTIRGGVLGASPELLFHRNANNLSTMALAGTLPKMDTNGHPNYPTLLFEDPKELHEHQLVVEDLTEKLGRLASFFSCAPFNLNLLGPQILELPHLFHLKTTIEAKLPIPVTALIDFDFRALHLLHPTSALGLRSSTTHWHWLKGLRGHKNLGHFGAPFGIALPAGFLCLVAIRNIEWNSTKSYIRSGCGVVAQSKLDREWDELRAKRDSVKALLGLRS
jgi:menaquinone-specific isochorismate synthase